MIELDTVRSATAANAIGRGDMTVTVTEVEILGAKLNVGMLGVLCVGLDYE